MTDKRSIINEISKRVKNIDLISAIKYVLSYQLSRKNCQTQPSNSHEMDCLLMVALKLQLFLFPEYPRPKIIV